MDESENRRQPIGKKVRFEVFKRDSFTCQYCGAKAPEAVLVIDHIKPVVEGGDNHIMNLITSCQPCNAGKGKRELNDTTVIDRQMAQLEEINERRLQLEMLMSWRDDMLSLDALKVDKIEQILNGKSEASRLSDHGIEVVEKWVKKYQFDELVTAIDAAFETYFTGKDGTWNRAFEMVPAIIRVNAKCRDKPYMRDLYYARGILRKRGLYVNEKAVMQIMEDAVLAGAQPDEIRARAAGARNWTQFRDYCESFVYEDSE